MSTGAELHRYNGEMKKKYFIIVYQCDSVFRFSPLIYGQWAPYNSPKQLFKIRYI